MLKNIAHAVYRSLRAEKEPRPWFSLAGTGLFCVALLCVHAHHELWRDELHCWSVGRNAAGFWDILTGIRRYDGHPFLWYYVLHLASRLSRSATTLHGITILIATGSGYLWLRDSPLPRALRLSLLPTYLFFYEYGVLSRSYALGLLCLFLFCRFYRRRPLRIPLLSLLLVAFSLTSAYGALIAVALAAMLFLHGASDVVRAEALGETRPRLALRLLVGVATLALGLELFWYTSLPPEDGFLAIPGLLETIPQWTKVAECYWLANFPRCNPGNGIWMVTAAMGDQLPAVAPLLPWAGLALFFTWLVALRKVPPVALAYGLGVLAIAGFQHYKYGGFIRHFGHHFVLLIACIWLHEKLRAEGSAPRLLRALFAVTLVAQIVTGAQAVKVELERPFSGSLQAATFLRAHDLADAPLVGSFDHAASVVAGYLDRPFRSAESNQVVTSVIFHNRRWQGLPVSVVFQMAVADARRAGRPAIVVLNRDVEDYALPDATIEKLYTTDLPIVADERFSLLRVTPSRATEAR
jgi:hypothetical protein